jgi:ribosomal protein S18 acetylase RimI-like enzyme
VDDLLTIERGTLKDLPSLREQWLGLHRHHQRVMPELSPYVSEDESWAVRAALYRAVLSQPASVLLLAKEDARMVGYALGLVLGPEAKSWLDDTWVNTGAVGEIESLGVSLDRRGRGIGSKLLQRLEEELRSLGARDLVLGVLPGNAQAISLYERFGYRPTWMYLSKLDGRG